MRLRLGYAPLLAVICACSSSSTTDTGSTNTGDTGTAGADTGQQGVDAGAGDTGTTGGDTGTVTADSGPADVGFPPGPVDVAGSWATRTIGSSCWNGPSGKDTVQTTVTTRYTITQNGLDLMTSIETCLIEFSPYRGSTTTYPEAAIRSIPVYNSTGRLERNEYPAKLIAPDTIAVYGWAPAGDPRTDPLPTMANDARVRDSDMDNHPGITIRVGGAINGELYTVSRSIVQYRDIFFLRPDRAEGFNTTTSEQSSLGANPPLLAFTVIQSSPNPDLRSSTNILVKLPANMSSCADIVANRQQLFGTPPAVTPCP